MAVGELLNRTEMSATLHKDLGTFYCCLLRKIAVKAFLCNAQCLYTADSGTTLHSTHKTHVLLFHYKNGRGASVLRCTAFAYLTAV